MEGRLERQLQREHTIGKRLKDAPAYMQEYFSSLISSDKETSTAGVYINNAFDFLHYVAQQRHVDTLNALDITSITLGDVESYFAHKRYVKKKGKLCRASGSYRTVLWSSINKFCHFLTMHNYLSENPVAKTERPKNKDDHVQISMNHDEVETVINNVTNGVGNSNAREKQATWRKRDKLIIMMFLITGMRVSALSEINLQDFNDELTSLKVITKGGVTHHYTINQTLKELIQDWMQKREQLLNGATSDALFISNRRKRMSTNSIRALVTKYTAGVNKHITPHKFRSTYGTELLAATKDIYFVQQCMGHANISTTERYIASTSDQRLEASSIMEQFISR